MVSIDISLAVEHRQKLTVQIGQVSLDEILETWGAEDQKEKDSIGAFFKEKDISGDQKLSLAGEYQSTYGGCCPVHVN